MEPHVIQKRRQQVMYDVKWKKFLRRARLFRHIPFVEFACAAGSMATGAVSGDSDFDVILGARQGRIFTARFFSIFAFDLFGWRRRNLDHGAAAADTVCLNHFVTPRSYRLSRPHNEYWKFLYRRLVPVFGRRERFSSFFRANSGWMGEIIGAREDRRHLPDNDSAFKRAIEWMFRGSAGNGFERFARFFQIRRIEKKLRPMAGYKPRLIVSDEELELHLDTRRIEEFRPAKAE